MKSPLRPSSALATLACALVCFSSCSKEKNAAEAPDVKKPAQETASTLPDVPEGERPESAQAPSPDGEKATPESADTATDASASPTSPAEKAEPEAAATGDTRPSLARYLGAKTDEERLATIRALDPLNGEAKGAIIGSNIGEGPDAPDRPAGGVMDEEKAQILGNAAREGTPEVAAAAMETARNDIEELQMSVLRNALASENPATRQMAVNEIAEARPKYRIDYVFPSLDDPDPGVRATTADALEGIFGERFESPQAADAWWATHANEFDQSLRPVPPAGN